MDITALSANAQLASGCEHILYYMWMLELGSQ